MQLNTEQCAKEKIGKILIVDDDELVLFALKEVLSAHFIVEIAGSGKEALERMHSFIPDIVLLDVLMPEMDGHDVCKHIRSDPHFQFIKIIMLSAGETVNDRIRGYEAGADDYLTKPFDFDELVAKVKVFSKLKFTEESDQALRIEREEQRALIEKLQDIQEQLLQADKMASIGLLAAGVAHEINNPIGYVGSNLISLNDYIKDIFAVLGVYEQLEPCLKKVGVDGTLLEDLNRIKSRVNLDYLKQDIFDLLDESSSGIQRVRQIVQDLKDFSHVDEEEWQWVDLHRGLDSTLNIVNNEIKYKAEVKKDYGELPQIECLGPQINQVFMNLLVNAAQAIENHGEITVRTGTKDDFVWVEITDTGCGINSENLKRIFDPFYTSKPLGKGTGLGLSLSYSIVNKHDGRIEVVSEAGKGTTFRVYLPMRRGKVLEEVAC